MLTRGLGVDEISQQEETQHVPQHSSSIWPDLLPDNSSGPPDTTPPPSWTHPHATLITHNNVHQHTHNTHLREKTNTCHLCVRVCMCSSVYVSVTELTLTNPTSRQTLFIYLFMMCDFFLCAMTKSGWKSFTVKEGVALSECVNSNNTEGVWSPLSIYQ